MHLLHRSAKRACTVPFTGLAELPFHAFLHRCLLEDEQKNVINKFTRHFSVFADDRTHETSLKNQQEGRLLIDVHRDVSLSQRMLLSEERKCGDLELAGGATILNSVTHVGYEKKNRSCCNGGISELVVAEAGTIAHINKEKRKQFDSITSELAEANFLSKQKEGNKHFDGSASELAIFNPCKASCKDINKQKHFDSSMWEHASEPVQTMKFPSRGKQKHIVNDSTSQYFVCDIKSMSGNHTGELKKKERLNLSVENTETGLQKEDIKDASEVCLSDSKTSLNENAEERTCSDLCGFLKGVDTLEKAESFTTEQGLVSRPCERVSCALQKKIRKNKEKKKKKKKKKSWNTNRQFGPEDLEHLSLTPHPSRIAAAGQALCKEKPKVHRESFKDEHTCLPNYSLIRSKIISPIACQKSPGYVDSIDSVSWDALKVNDKEKGESVDAIFADRRQVNQVITNVFVEENKKLFTCENSCKSSLNQGQKSGEVSKSPDTEHMTGKIWRQWEKEKGPSSWQEDAHRPLLLAKKEQAHLNDLSHKGSSSPTHLIGKWRSVHSTMKPLLCKENEAENEASGYFLGNRGKMIAYNQIKDGTSLDPSSNFWDQVRTVSPVETIECGVERAKWDLAGVRKVHYPLRNYRELYIILDLNGVLIKRWDKNPSLPGVSKLNKKWIQLRPGCIEFLQKSFSSFRVGIWSTMTQRNVLSLCNFLEQQAHQSLPFFMLWSKDSCYQHRGVQRPNKSNVVADFKPLSRVWGYFKPYLGFHNTILVDDSPYKACMNNPYNCIFPDAFEGYTDDKFLNDVLWPYLEKMRMSHNIQAYIANNPLGQAPVVVGHELYHHIHQVIDVFDYCASPLTRAG